MRSWLWDPSPLRQGIKLKSLVQTNLWCCCSCSAYDRRVFLAFYDGGAHGARQCLLLVMHLLAVVEIKPLHHGYGLEIDIQYCQLRFDLLCTPRKLWCSSLVDFGVAQIACIHFPLLFSNIVVDISTKKCATKVVRYVLQLKCVQKVRFESTISVQNSYNIAWHFTVVYSANFQMFKCI